jgi:isoleucyl-tRNA synthetase
MPTPPSSDSPFRKVEAQASFPKLEEAVLALWREHDAFPESNRRRAGNTPFVFYDGPPFATGTPHYGHLLTCTIKDIVPRYWNMRGHPVERRFGWDCHGLPIEALAQEALGLAGTSQILALGVDAFNQQCRQMVLTYVAEWRTTVTRMGRWVDFDNDYKTMDPSFMESVWWVFKRLWDEGRVYKSYRVMPYSYKLTTPLSNFEANSNYKQIQDPAITVAFEVTGGVQKLGVPSSARVHLLAWTTTPWTLPSNLALCVGPDIEYVCVQNPAGTTYVLAAARLPEYQKIEPNLGVIGRLPGRELVGLQYKPLLP